MTNREHAVDPSTLPDGTFALVRDARGTEYVSIVNGLQWRMVPSISGRYRGLEIVAVLHRADECPPAEQWRQVTPEEVREGWLVERRKGDALVRGRVDVAVGDNLDDRRSVIALWYRALGHLGWTLWTNEPADPDAERRRLIEAATGRNAETLEASLAEYGLAIVEVDRG